MTPIAHSVNSAPTDRPELSFWTKLSYGIGTIGTSSTGSMLAFLFLFFLTDVAGIPAALAGSILMIGQISDAVSDPIIGLMSDRTKSKWGRRYPWIIAGAIPFGVSFFLLWVIPSDSKWILFIYYVISGIIFKTAFTAVYLPYVSLTPELAKDYNARTRLNSFRFSFSIGSSILALALSSLVFHFIDNPPRRYLILGVVGGLLCIIPLYICVLGTWKAVRFSEDQYIAPPKTNTLPFHKQILIALTNKPFLSVVGIYLCSWLAAQMTAVVMQYFVVSWMGLESADFTNFALVVQGTALTMLFVWSAVSQRIGKRAVFFMGTSIWVVAQFGLFFLQPGQVGPMFFLGFLAGFGVSTSYLVPWSMLPDVIELDELKTGYRREGVFYAFMVMVQKIGIAFGIFLVGQALSLAGYIENLPGEPPVAVQPESALFVIRLVIGPISTVILILGLILAYFYPISREVHATIVMQLHERKQKQQKEALFDSETSVALNTTDIEEPPDSVASEDDH
ncbi:MAG: MFS transporter [Cyanobacteria bacterium P01_E01_bin.6]